MVRALRFDNQTMEKGGPKDCNFLGSLMLEDPDINQTLGLQMCTRDMPSHLTRPPELRQGWITRGETAS